MNRRTLLQHFGLGLGLSMTGTALALEPLPALPLCTPKGLRKVALRPAQPIHSPLHPESLAPFVDPLPIPPIARSSGTRPNPGKADELLPCYRMPMRAVECQVHRDLKPTRFWCYGGSLPGPTFETRSGQGLLVEWVNELPQQHFLPIDHNLHGAGADLPEVRTVVHVHGAKAPPESDGYPEHWYTPGQSAVSYYPNRQDAATLWYHDHAMGIERLNQYAGLFGAFLIRDEVEQALQLPQGAYEIPLLLCDRVLDRDGQLRYPTSGMADAPWVSEVYGDVHLVNGKLAPYLEVEPRLYRFRIINAANSRFYNLSLSDGLRFCQIGSDQGLLPAPVTVNSVLLAPAERIDVLVDFSALAGKRTLLRSQSLELMQFRVLGKPQASVPKIPAVLRHVPKIPRSAAVRSRTLTLNQYQDPASHMMLMLLNGTYWRQPATERPLLDSVETWNLVNLTDDNHPIHLHLVRFQVIERQPFDIDQYLLSGKMRFIGPPQPPRPGETGWKDTVQAPSEMITRIIMRFEGFPGRYVWHCHVLEHAANEMMRPFEVISGHRHGKSQ